MKNINKICPITKNNCLGQKCMCFVIGLNNCSLNVIAQALDYQADAVKEIEEIIVEKNENEN